MQYGEDFSQYGGEYDAGDFTQYGGDDDLDLDQLEHFAYGGGNNSDDRRKFTVFEVDGEEVDLGDGGRYTVTMKASPSDAARKAFSSLCRKLKKTHFTFSIRETTQGSKKKVYGPYIGNRKRLSKPKVYHRMVKGKKKSITIKHKHHVKLHKQKGGQYFYA
jgi:hypothetical protein